MKTQKKYYFLLAAVIILSLLQNITPAFSAVKKQKPLKPETGKIDNTDIKTAFREGFETYYSIKADDKLMGFTLYKIERKMELAGQSFVKFQSLSRIKTGIGSIEDIVFQTEFTASKQNLMPAYLSYKQVTGENIFQTEVVFSSGLVAQKNQINKDQSSYILPIDSACYLFINNLWGQMDTFIDQYLLFVILARRGITQIPVYDPILKTKGTIEVTFIKNEKLEINSTAFQCKMYQLKNFYGIPQMNVWYDPKWGRIIKMKEIGGPITFEICNNTIVSALQKAKGIDFIGYRSVPSPIYFSDPQLINRMSVEANFSGKGFLDPNHKILGFEQSFTGEFTDVIANGKFEIKTSKPVIDKPNPFPPKNIPDDLKTYLSYQAGIEKDNDFLKNKAMEITWKSKDSWTAASKINKWIKDNIKSGPSLPAALLSLASGVGNTESRALIMVAMCRAVGIPARKVGGMAFRDGNFIPQHWVEVYLENNGWVPFDPETGSEGLIDSTRIYLWEFGDISKVEFISLDFDPKPPKSVSYYNKDLTWPVGEEKTFSIKKGEKIIGEEKAIIEDIIFEEGKETYLFNCSSTLDIDGNPYNAKGKLYITPRVLPIEFTFESDIGGKTNKQHFKFDKDFISQLIGEGENEKKRDIPYSKGTYLIDQRFLSQWALVIGQIPKPQLGKKYVFTVFVPEDLKTREIELEVKNFERIEIGSIETNAFRCESKKGMIFYIDPSGNVVKIALPTQEIEVDLIKKEYKMKN